MEKIIAFVDELDKKAKDIETAKSLITNLEQWINQLDFDITYHNDKLIEEPNNVYHTEQLAFYIEKQDERIKFAKVVIDAISKEFKI